jgi:hypothetical protein
MKFRWIPSVTLSLLALTAAAAVASDTVLPAGMLLQCTLNEPNFSSKTVEIGDPVLCNLKGQIEFGQQAFARGSYLVGHLESAKDPGHLVGKGNLKIVFDRIGLPSGDVPINAKLVATRGYKVDKQGDIKGKGHAKRDAAEWMFPPLWPEKVLTLPARGPRPTLKGETTLTLRLMDDVELPGPAVAKAYEGGQWHSFAKPQNQSCSYGNCAAMPSATVPSEAATGDVLLSADGKIARASYASYVSRDTKAASGPAPMFVLKTGAVLDVKDYRYRDGVVLYTLDSGDRGAISADYVDWVASVRLNAEHGIRLTLHGGDISH